MVFVLFYYLQKIYKQILCVFLDRRFLFWRQEMKEKVFRLLYAPNFHGPVQGSQALCRFSALISALLLVIGQALLVFLLHFLYLKSLVFFRAYFYNTADTIVCRLVVGQSLTMRHVVPILGVPDALVPLDLPIAQINLLPGYCFI